METPTRFAAKVVPINIFIILLITAFVCLLFYPTLTYNYVYWDDDIVILNNDQIKQPPTLSNILSLFQIKPGPDYKPIMYALWTIVHHVGGTNPFGYHLVNILFYCMNILAVFFLTRELLPCLNFPYPIRRTYAAFLISLLFLAHPLHVEVVAWMADLKDLLAGACYFLCGFFYLLYRKKSSLKYYFMSMLFFLIGLLSKISVATLPIMLVFLDMAVFKIKYHQRGTFLGILPFFVLASGIMSNSAFFVEPSVASHEVAFATKVLSALVLVKDYLELLFLPLPSQLCHGYYNDYIETISEPRAIASVLIFLAIAFLSVLCFKKFKIISIAVFWFLLNLAPTSNLVQIGIMKADRYAYLSSFGWTICVFFMIYSTVSRLSAQWPVINKQAILNIVFFMALLLLSVLSKERMPAWKDDISLWEDGFHKSQAITVLSGLAYTYVRHGRLDEAIDLYRERYRSTGNVRLYRELANFMFKAGQETDGKKICLEALEIWPHDASVNFQLGLHHIRRQEYGHAQACLARAVRSDPLALGPYVALTHIHLLRGQIKEAISLYLALIEKEPYPEALNNLGIIYMKVNDYKNAVSCFEWALKQGEDPAIRSNLERAMGKI